MSTRTSITLLCPCGHTGSEQNENDQPYSRAWSDYSLKNLKGLKSDYYAEGFVALEKVFNYLKPSCPECGSALTEKNVTRP
jgi:hypothetical protein